MLSKFPYPSVAGITWSVVPTYTRIDVDDGVYSVIWRCQVNTLQNRQISDSYTWSNFTQITLHNMT